MKLETAALSDGAWLSGRASLVTRSYGASGEDVTPRPAIRSRGASQQDPRRTICEVAINSVTSNRRKDSCRRQVWRRTPEPKWQAARREHSQFAPSSLVVRPEDSHRLKAQMNVSRVKPVKPVVPCPGRGSIQSVSNGEGTAGKGGRSKRRPPRSGADRATPEVRSGDTHPERGQTSGWCWRERNSWDGPIRGDVRRWNE